MNTPNWDTRKLEALKSWPTGTPINWTTIGQQHGTTNKNKGQIAKKFAANLGIDPSILEGEKHQNEGYDMQRKGFLAKKLAYL